MAKKRKGKAGRRIAENEEFLEYLFKKHVKGRLSALWEYWKPWKYPWQHIKARLLKENSIIRHINGNCVSFDEVSETYRPERLEAMVRVVRGHARFNTKALEIAGILDCFDNHFNQIVRGFEIESYSQEELDLLHELGVADPRTELRGILLAIQSDSRPKESVTENLHWADKRLEKAGGMIAEEAEDSYQASDSKPTSKASPKRKRSSITEGRFRTLELDSDEEEWTHESEAKSGKRAMRTCKGIGEITIGVTMSLADLALALASFQRGVLTPHEVTTLFVSTGTGVGTIIKGIGELRSE